MSIPYLIHKTDADRFDAISKALESFRVDYNSKLEQEKSLTDFNSRESRDSLEAYIQELGAEFNKHYVRIVAEHGGEVPTVSAFAEQPLDLENYYSYYRGFRWGEAKGDRMMDIALNGIADIKKILD